MQKRRPKKPQKPRRHFIPEHLKAAGKKPVDVIAAGIADKSTVYRWINENQLPHEKHMLPLADFLGTTPEGLLTHPDQEWILENYEWVVRKFRGRSPDEEARMKNTLDSAFPDNLD